MPKSLSDRVEDLEQQVQDFSKLPAHVVALETQFLQLRADMNAGFSAIREEIHVGDEETRRYMRVLHEEVLARIAQLGDR